MLSLYILSIVGHWISNDNKSIYNINVYNILL